MMVLTETCTKVDLSCIGYEGRASAPNKYGKNYSAIWSKWPMGEVFDTYDAQTATCAMVTGPLGPMVIYGTILTYRGDRGPDGDSGSWAEHHKEILRQGEDWLRIQSLAEGIPLIVAGDFNQSRDGSSWYRSPQGIVLLDDQLARNNLTSLTDEDFGANVKLQADPKKGYCRHNIDHVCVTQGRFHVEQVGAWDHFTAGGELSDHNGVFVELVAANRGAK